MINSRTTRPDEVFRQNREATERCRPLVEGTGTGLTDKSCVEQGQIRNYEKS